MVARGVMRHRIETPDSSQHLCHSLGAHRGEQCFQLPHEVPHEIRVTVDGLHGLNQDPFTLLAGWGCSVAGGGSAIGPSDRP